MGPFRWQLRYERKLGPLGIEAAVRSMRGIITKSSMFLAQHLESLVPPFLWNSYITSNADPAAWAYQVTTWSRSMISKKNKCILSTEV